MRSRGTARASRVAERPQTCVLYSRFLSASHITAIASRTRVCGQVAQLVEHVTENHGVGGSIPSLATKMINNFS
jgi:hypothetical protein